MLRHLKLNKKIFIAVFLLFFLFLFSFLYWFNYDSLTVNKNRDEYKIGFITDVHSFRTKKNNYDLNDRSRVPLIYFINKMNSDFKPNFVIQNGDFIEGSFREGKKSIDDFIVADKYLRKLKMSYYHIIGNHETRGFSREDWRNLTKNEKTYYYFDYNNLRVIALDGNEIERDDIEGDFYFVSEEQIKWLENSLRDATEKKFKKIIFTHIPFAGYEAEGIEKGKKIFPEDARKVRSLLAKYGAEAVFSGHLEVLNYKEVDNIKHFSLPGFFKSKEEKISWKDCFYEITLSDKIEIKMFYKQESDENYKELLIPSEEFENMEK